MDRQKELIREFHILLNRLGVNDNGKEGILSAYGVESSKDLSVAELSEVNEWLHAECRKRGLEHEKQQQPRSEIDKERQRCKVATGKYLARKGYIKQDGWGLMEWHKIQNTICRAAKTERFYDIPLSTLRGITYEFNRQRKAMESAAEVAEQEDIDTSAKIG
ncbi:MAG: hypothetical protein IJS05_06480 [Paludibacteraceae bacterium]|nr:hypothetical protein [Paludibacteraceae bacterium]